MPTVELTPAEVEAVRNGLAILGHQPDLLERFNQLIDRPKRLPKEAVDRARQLMMSLKEC